MSGVLPRAARVLRAADAMPTASDRIELDYDQRFLRRRRLVPASGRAFLVDLAETTSLENGDQLCLDDGQVIEVRAAPEPLLCIRPTAGTSLARLAWHIGNRHTPCAVGTDHLLIRRDPVLGKMLAGLGATLTNVTAPFCPEGGAYGTGRTMGHAHGPDAHDHAEGHTGA